MDEDGRNPGGSTRRSRGSSNLGSLTPRKKPPRKPRDPQKEWEKVKYAWRYDQEAWEKYSGFKLPTS